MGIVLNMVVILKLNSSSFRAIWDSNRKPVVFGTLDRMPSSKDYTTLFGDHMRSFDFKNENLLSCYISSMKNLHWLFLNYIECTNQNPTFASLHNFRARITLINCFNARIMHRSKHISFFSMMAL